MRRRLLVTLIGPPDPGCPVCPLRNKRDFQPLSPDGKRVEGSRPRTTIIEEGPCKTTQVEVVTGPRTAGARGQRTVVEHQP